MRLSEPRTDVNSVDLPNNPMSQVSRLSHSSILEYLVAAPVAMLFNLSSETR